MTLRARAPRKREERTDHDVRHEMHLGHDVLLHLQLTVFLSLQISRS
jgi:hypothetical protein